MPTFEFREWLTGLALVIGVMNALGHTIATILGHTVNTVQFPRPAPGFYSSPLLLIVSIYALQQLGRTRRLPSSVKGGA